MTQQLSKQEALRAKQESNQRATEENLRTREAIHAESLAKRALIRAKSLAIEDSHRRQIERSEAQRAEERRQVMEAKAQAMRDDGKEEAMVREYIAEVLAEPWMKGNPRAKSVDAYHKKAFAQSMEMASAVTKSAVTKGKKAQQKSKA